MNIKHLFLLILILPSLVVAGKADVVKVKFTKDKDSYTFNVTVKHNDTGWEHFANRWEVLLPNGKILATRKLMHPHIKEQPFTRSLSGIKIPKGIKFVIIRAHDLVHGYGGKKLKVFIIPQG